MVILSLGSQYKPNQGGNAKRVSTMVEGFAELGCKVIIGTTTINNNDFNDNNYYKTNGIKIFRFNSHRDMFKRINRLIKKNNVDIILCHNNIVWLYCSLFIRKTLIVNECHAMKQSVKWKEIIKRLGYIIMKKRTGALFVLSNNAKNIFVNKYKFDENKIHFTPNGIEKYINKDLINFNSKDKFVYMYAGTLYKWQGIKILLENCKAILDISPDVIIKIVGGGPMFNEVEHFIKDNELSNRIIITGYLDKKEFDQQLLTADVILIPRPSTLETETAIPLKIFDAVRSSKPIVMSDVLGLTEVLSDKEALIYSSDQPEKLVDCCKKIYRNEDLAFILVNAANKKIESWPSDSQIVMKQFNIMKDLIKTKKANIN